MEEKEISTAGDETKSTIWKSAATYGMYFAILSILVTIVLYVTDSMMWKPFQYIYYALIIIFIVWVQLHFRKSLGGYISYGQSLGIAVLSMLFAAIPIAVFTYILYKFIDPGLIDQLKLAAEEQLVGKGLPEEQLEAALTLTSKLQTPGILSASQLLNLPFNGLIVGLISSIFIRKESSDKIFE